MREFVTKCPCRSRDSEKTPLALQHPCLQLRVRESERMRARSIVLPGTVQMGEDLKQEMQLTLVKAVNFKMHGPRASCRGARGAPCSTDCMSAVVHGSVRFSYLLAAETFPLCFDGGEGKHKSLLSRSLPPSPSRRRFSRSPFFLQQRCKNEPQSSCTWSPFAFDACASAPAAAVPMHGVRGDGRSAISANTLQKNSPQHLHDGPRAGS